MKTKKHRYCRFFFLPAYLALQLLSVQLIFPQSFFLRMISLIQKHLQILPRISQQQQMKLLLPTAQTPWKNQPMTCSSHPMILHLLKTEQMILPQIALILSVPAKRMIFPIPREMMIFLPERQNRLWPVSWMIHWKLRWPEKEALLLKQISRYLLPSLPHVRYIKAATWRARIILTGLHLWNLILLQVRMVILCAFRAEPLRARS